MERDTEVEVRRAAGPTDIARSDLLSWSSIVAGVMVAFGLFVLFGAIATAAGLEADNPKFGREIGLILTGIFGVVAFMIGGFVAAWTADVDEADSAITHGFLVWALFVVLAAAMISLGAGSALGALGGLGPIDPNLTPDEVENASWATVFALTIAVASTVLGALLATREEILGRFARRDTTVVTRERL